LLGDHLLCVGVVGPTVCWVSLVVLLPWVCCSRRACCRLIVLVPVLVPVFVVCVWGGTGLLVRLKALESELRCRGVVEGCIDMG